jgi:hypothetical protein
MAESGKPIQHNVAHSLVGYIYILSKHHMFSLANHLMLFFQATSRKKFTCLFSEKYLPMCLLQHKHPLIRQFPEKKKNHDTTVFKEAKNFHFKYVDARS